MSKVAMVSKLPRIVKLICFACTMILPFGCIETKEETVELRLENSVSVATPVFLNAEDLKGLDLEDLVLFQNGEDINIQIDTDKLWFVQSPEEGANYHIGQAGHSAKKGSVLSTRRENGNFQLLSEGNNPLLSYRYAMKYPPKGVDSIFGKSGYIHPIVSPKGDTLTRIQPPDHYHHYGLWGPWTHTRIDTTRVDFWNLKAGMGTVLFKEFKNTSSGNVFSSFTAVQEHIDLKSQEKTQVALNEDLQVRLWNLNRPDRYMFDYTSNFSSPLAHGILFEAYRYGGGLGFRFTERWKADNCSVLTSEGKDRLTADGSNARWAIVSGASSDGLSTNGILFMSYPENRMHPEPMRVWPIDGNGGRGDMFFEFCPIRHEEWQIEPNKKYQLKYRMVVFDGALTPEEAESYWQAFAKPPSAKIKLTELSN